MGEATSLFIGRIAGKEANALVSPVDILLLAAVVYLIYRVHRLEDRLGGRSGMRRTVVRTADGGKIIPILKDRIEPGPFKPEPGKSDR